MASGDIVFEADNCVVFDSGFNTDDGSDAWKAELNLGGTTSNTRFDATLVKHLSSAGQSPLDPTKTYDVIIKEH